jgi:glutamate synthase domain-containing protein 3
MTGGRVIVIGETGRNFAAGMSGGLAYVLDEDGKLDSRTNHELVELEALSPDDAAFVAELLAEHHERTGSAKAAELLARWEETLGKMVKIVPVEYRKVLEEIERRRADAIATEPVEGEPLPVPRGNRHATEAE